MKKCCSEKLEKIRLVLSYATAFWFLWQKKEEVNSAIASLALFCSDLGLETKNKSLSLKWW